MPLSEADVEQAALGWFNELGYTVLPGPRRTGGRAGVVQQFGAEELIAFQGVKWVSII
jgi:hypothetical protein